MLTRLDHVQLLMPPGGQERGRIFFGSVLGMTEEAIPPAFAGLGGLWFRSGSAVLHLAVLENAVGQKKAHPAFCVRDLAEAATRLRAAGCEVLPDDQIAGRRRLFTRDPFDNRIELIQDGDGFSQRPVD